jgi:type II secretion system protein H
MSRRHGYTLLEMLVVVALIAALVALAFPAMRGALAKRQLRDAAAQIRIELAKARLEAIESGTVGMFRYQPGSRRFVLLWQAAEGSDTADPLDVTPVSPPLTRELPHDIRFVDPDWEPSAAHAASVMLSAGATAMVPVESASSTNVQEDLSGPAQGDWSRAVFFYPTGRTSDVRLRLLGRNNDFIDVTLRGLTGSVKIGPLRRPRPPEETL